MEGTDILRDRSIVENISLETSLRITKGRSVKGENYI
jgi:hypothetical protein